MKLNFFIISIFFYGKTNMFNLDYRTTEILKYLSNENRINTG